jgi:hypothetical protein
MRIFFDFIAPFLNMVLALYMLRELSRRKVVMDEIMVGWRELIKRKIELQNDELTFFQRKIDFEKEVRAFQQQKKEHP